MYQLTIIVATIILAEHVATVGTLEVEPAPIKCDVVGVTERLTRRRARVVGALPAAAHTVTGNKVNRFSNISGTFHTIISNIDQTVCCIANSRRVCHVGVEWFPHMQYKVWCSTLLAGELPLSC